MQTPVDQMRHALQTSTLETPPGPSHWGDMRQHIFYGAVYHLFLLFFNRAYPNFQGHRNLPVRQKFKKYLRKLLFTLPSLLRRELESRRLHLAGAPYHLVLMQLQHDSAFQAHSPFTTNKEFLDQVLHGFAKGAPRHHLLVIKAHPLEPDSPALHQIVCALAQKHQVMDRVRYVEGGKLAKTLKQARSAVTVNSTAGQQAFWRGIPLKIFGAVIYAKPDFTSQQGRADFSPPQPDPTADRIGYLDVICCKPPKSQADFILKKGVAKLRVRWSI
jgi:capsular polysaccharide export protein